jgi:hypothetical protein
MKPTPLLLLLPLAWASCGFAQTAQQTPSSAHVWRQAPITDAVRAMTYTRFTLAGKFPAPPQNAGANRPALAVDCIPAKDSHSSKGKYLAASLLVGTPLKIIYVEPEEIHGTSYYPKAVVQYRTDDGKEGQEKWSPVSEKEKTSFSIPREALKKILRARTVAITAEDDQGSPVAMQFDMPDPAAVEAGCNVDW